MQNAYFASEIKIPRNMSNSILQLMSSCSVQKTAPKNYQYSRNETILKIGHHAKAGAHEIPGRRDVGAPLLDVARGGCLAK